MAELVVDGDRPHHRGSLDLPDECWDFVDRIAERDGVTRAFFVEGLILLAMDHEERRAAGELHAKADAIRARGRPRISGRAPGHMRNVTVDLSHRDG